MIVTQGTFFQRNTPSNFNFPHIIKKYPQFHSFRFSENGLFSGHLPSKAFVSLLLWNSEAWDIITYYQKDLRKRQADLARMVGLSGFVFYHYWFSDIHAPENHLVMDKIHEALLHDEDPNMPLMLSWANEPWSQRWTGLILRR
jgi:hypothetical protein